MWTTLSKRVMDHSFVRYTCTLLTDFIQTAKGLRLEEEPEAHNLNALVAALVAEILARPGAPTSLEDIPDDPAGFCEFLISSIAHVPIFKDIALRYDRPHDDVRVRLVVPRFQDSLKRFLEDLVDWGAQAITLRVVRETSKAHLVVDAVFTRGRSLRSGITGFTPIPGSLNCSGGKWTSSLRQRLFTSNRVSMSSCMSS